MRRVIIVILVLLNICLVSAVLYQFYVAARWTPEFRASARGSDRLVIKTGCPCHPDPQKDVIRFETDDTNTIAQVLLMFGTTPDAPHDYQHRISPTLYFYRGDRMLAAVSLHSHWLYWYRGKFSNACLTQDSFESLRAFLTAHQVQPQDFR
jgi:hypothetical protein